MKNSREDLEFDKYAENYYSTLETALAVSGEDPLYFARGRIAWLTDCLRGRHERCQSVLDFGCEIGIATPFLFDLVGAESVVGTDASPKSLEIAEQTFGSDRAQFLSFDQYTSFGKIDWRSATVCSITFRFMSALPQLLIFTVHCAPEDCLRFENNPWNPGTRYVMSRCPFDRDAIMLTPPGGAALTSGRWFRDIPIGFLVCIHTNASLAPCCGTASLPFTLRGSISNLVS